LSGVKFASTGLARAVAEMCASGFLNACSVGFAPGQFRFSQDPERRNGIDFVDGHELLELSIVPIPANQEALLQSISGAAPKSMGDDRARLRAKLSRELELMRVRLAPPSAAEKKADRRRVLAEMRARQ
jgi:phage head maturation protease